MVELIVFVIAGAVVLGGALGVILSANTSHAALSLVATLFGVAVLFIAQVAEFLAAVQVIVYAGAIVVLFLFVMMLLGVDREEDLSIEPLRGQRAAAIIGGALFFAMLLVALLAGGSSLTGLHGDLAFESNFNTNVVLLGRSLFTDYVVAFEATALLLTIAVVGAVVLVRRTPGSDDAIDGSSSEAGR
jgi:NADH-quinone oxidoreductase subunit J